MPVSIRADRCAVRGGLASYVIWMANRSGIKLLQGFEISLIMRSYSLIVCLSLLSLSVGSEFLGMPIIFRLLACMFSNSSERY